MNYYRIIFPTSQTKTDIKVYNMILSYTYKYTYESSGRELELQIYICIIHSLSPLPPQYQLLCIL